MFFDIFTSSKETDTDRGLKYMREFHNYTTLNYPSNYRMTFQELERYTGQGFSLVLGRAINATGEISDNEIKWAAEYLADQNQGKLPPDSAKWIEALAKANESYFSHGYEYLTGAAKDVGEVALDATKAVYSGAVSGAKEVVSDAGGIVTSGLSSLAVPILMIGGIAIIGIMVAGKSGAVRITRAV